MRNKIFQVALLLSCVLIFASFIPHKTNREVGIKYESKALKREHIRYKKFVDEPVNGNIKIKGTHYGSQPHMKVYANCYDQNKDAEIYHSFSYDDVLIPSSGGIFKKPFYNVAPSDFGVMHKVLMMANSTDTLYCDSLYAHLGLNWSVVGANNTIGVNSEVIWVADPRNFKGVVITVDCWRMDNMDKPDLKSEDLIRNQVHVIDDGSYRLDAEIFDKIPKGARVIVTISRGNYKLVNCKINPGRKYKWTIIMREQGKFKFI